MPHTRLPECVGVQFYSKEMRDLLSMMLVEDVRHRPQVKDILQVPIVQRQVAELRRRDPNANQQPQLSANGQAFSASDLLQKIARVDLIGMLGMMAQHAKLFVGVFLAAYALHKLQRWW